MKECFEGMTTLSFTRKNNLLSLLRGYDLPIKPNYLNSALLGFGNHHHHHHHHHDKLKKSEKKYEKFLTTVEPALETYYKFFNEQINNYSFWHDEEAVSDALCQFTRFYIALITSTSSNFLDNIESFVTDIVDSERYITLLEEMSSFANIYKETGELPEEYEKIKEESKDAIQEISKQNLHPDAFVPNYTIIIDLILDCIVYSTKKPEDFALIFDKFTRKVNSSSNKDISRLFSEDLKETENKDELEHDEVGDSEDEDFIPDDDDDDSDDDYDEEYEENPVKRRKVADSDEEGEVNGSGFYDWWW